MLHSSICEVPLLALPSSRMHCNPVLPLIRSSPCAPLQQKWQSAAHRLPQRQGRAVPHPGPAQARGGKGISQGRETGERGVKARGLEEKGVACMLQVEQQLQCKLGREKC